MATIILPFIVTVVGLVLYALASNAKPAEIGRIIFMVGLFWLVYLLAHTTLHF